MDPTRYGALRELGLKDATLEHLREDHGDDALPWRVCRVDRLESYRALQHDVHRLQTKHDALARHEARKRERAFGRLVREATALKKR